MSTRSQDEQFLNDVVGTGILDSAVDWIKGHLEVEEVFTEKQLTAWAEANGYTKEEPWNKPHS